MIDYTDHFPEDDGDPVGEFSLWPQWKRQKIFSRVSEIVGIMPLQHGHIEEALQSFYEYRNVTIEEDWFHELVTEIYAEYIRTGGVDKEEIEDVG